MGTIAGLPLHDPTDGTAARQAALTPGHPAIVDPVSPLSIIVPLSGTVMQIGHGRNLLHVAGQLGGDSTSEDVQATLATLIGSTFVASSLRGLIIGDRRSIRRMRSNGMLELVAGNLVAGSSGDRLTPDGSPAKGSHISHLVCLFVDETSGDFYFCDGGSVVRVIRASGSQAGVLSTVAGNGSSSSSIDGFPAFATGFSDIRDVHTAPNGDLLIAENDNFNYPRIVRVSASDGRARLVAGNSSVSVSNGAVTQNSDSAYMLNGSAATNPLVGAMSVFVQQTTGRIFFCDSVRIMSITGVGSASENVITIIAGLIPSRKTAVIDNSLALETSFTRLSGLRQGSHFNEIIVVDSLAVYRRDLSAQRVVIAGGPVQLRTLTPQLASGESSSLATVLPLPVPWDLDIDKNGDIYSALVTGNVVVRISHTDGSMDVLAGSGEEGCAGDNVDDARTVPLRHPSSISLDGHGGLIIADKRCCIVRHLNLTTFFLKVIAGNTSYLI